MNDVLPEIIEFDDRKYLVQIMPTNSGKIFSQIFLIIIMYLRLSLNYNDKIRIYYCFFLIKFSFIFVEMKKFESK